LASPEPGEALPVIGVSQTSCRPAGPGQWLVTWTIRNPTPEAITLESAWLPHGQFRGERTELNPPPTLAPGASTELALLARCEEGPGSVVENAFIILTANWRNEPWRILVRLTIRIGGDGAPDATTETMTIQPVGFSERREPSLE
jgi:hypothetical protein